MTYLMTQQRQKDIRFVVEYWDIPTAVKQHINVGYSTSPMRRYKLHEDLEKALMYAAYLCNKELSDGEYSE
jgi:hypothetical protein